MNRAKKRGTTGLSWLLLLIAVASAVVLAGCGAAGNPSPASLPSSKPPTPRPAQVRPVTLDLKFGGAPGRKVPPRFLGLSFEAYMLPLIGSYTRKGNFLNLIRSLGPGTIRFSGSSVEVTPWMVPQKKLPVMGKAALQPKDFVRVYQLARRSHWQVILGVSAEHRKIAAAAAETVSALKAMRPVLAGIELGNEPDLYWVRGPAWSPSAYAKYVRAYVQAVNSRMGRFPLAGPNVALTNAFGGWSTFGGATQPLFLTGHQYSLTRCGNQPVSISRLLSEQTKRQDTAHTRVFLRVARQRNLPFRLDEANSVSCGGKPGVSNTYASALWATDFLARAASLGVRGVNLHGHLKDCRGYTPLCATSSTDMRQGRLVARPDWYALLLVKHLVGERFLKTRVKHIPGVSLWVTRGQSGTHVLVVNERRVGSRPIRLRLRAGRNFHNGTSLALTGPSLSARSGVKLGGASVGPDGRWAPASQPALRRQGNRLAAVVQPESAQLITLQ